MPILSDTAQLIVSWWIQLWTTAIGWSRDNPLWSMVIVAVFIGILLAVPFRYAWMYLRLWFWQACCWRGTMLGRFSNFGKRAEAADDLVRLVMHWKLRKIIKPGHADHLLKVLARDFGIYEIIPPKQPRPLSAKHVAYLKEEIRNGKRKLAGLPGTETNPSPKIPGGLPEPVTKKRTLRIVSG